MDRKGCKKYYNKSTLSGALLLLPVLLFASPGYSESDQQSQGTIHRPAGKHYYYPDHYFSPYSYQSTGDFADRPMVTPPSVPVMKQPAYFYMNGPQARQVLPSYAQRPYSSMSWQPQQAAPTPNYPQQYQAPNLAQPPLMPPPQYRPQTMQQPQPQTQQHTGQSAKGVGNSYSLHVGSFLVYSKADEIINKLKDLGLNPYRREVSAEGIRYLQVHVGPYNSKDELKKVSALLDKNKIRNRVALR